MPVDTDISGATPLHLIAELFSMDFALDLSAVLQTGEDVSALVYDCSASYYIETKSARDTFIFYTNDLLELNSGTDSLQFGVNTGSTGFADVWQTLQPANAQCLDASAVDLQTTAGIDNKNMVAHDFVRYLALSLFHNPKGTDLFANQNELLSRIRLNTSTAWGNVVDILEDETKAGGIHPGVDMLEVSAANDTSGNISYQLFQQIIHADPVRFQNLNSSEGLQALVGADFSGCYPMPFTDGDVISFTLTIAPAEGQNALTLVADPIPSRTYLINLIMTTEGGADQHNPTVDPAESV